MEQSIPTRVFFQAEMEHERQRTTSEGERRGVSPPVQCPSDGLQVKSVDCTLTY